MTHQSRHILDNVMASPWKVSNELRRLVTLPYVRFMVWLHGVKWGKNWRLYGTPIIQRYRSSKIVIGNGLHLRSTVRSNPLSPNHPVVFATRGPGSEIIIGRDFGMTGGTLCAQTSIRIGDFVHIGANSTVVDTDFHPLTTAVREQTPNEGKSVPVIIEDGVFIGANCIVLKGVRLGRGCTIGAGSVVSRSIPEGAIAAGNPARVLGEAKGNFQPPTAKFGDVGEFTQTPRVAHNE